MAPTRRRSTHPSPYGVHPGAAMEARAIAGLKAKTGRTLEEWIAEIRRVGPRTEPECAAWLKTQHELGTNYAKWLASRAAGGSLVQRDPDALVEAMYAGDKAALRSIHERLMKLALALGRDVTVTPCSTMVPIRRRYVIAQIKPASRTRVDLGLALKDTKANGRLLDTGGFAKKDRITHRIPITSVAEIDDEVVRWLRKAYEMDA